MQTPDCQHQNRTQNDVSHVRRLIAGPHPAETATFATTTANPRRDEHAGRRLAAPDAYDPKIFPRSAEIPYSA